MPETDSDQPPCSQRNEELASEKMPAKTPHEESPESCNEIDMADKMSGVDWEYIAVFSASAFVTTLFQGPATLCS